MNRDQFEHVLRAAVEVARCDELIVVGSQAILGTHPHPPPELLTSMEADVYPGDDPAGSDLIDGALGDGSAFHATFGYYAHGVDDRTAKLPAGWYERAARVPIPSRAGAQRVAVAVCPQPEDLVLSKLVAGRDRDLDYARTAIGAGVVDLDVMRGRVADLPVGAAEQDQMRSTLRHLADR